MNKIILITAMLTYSIHSYGDSFVHANDNTGTNVITHAAGYNGIDNVVTVNVCIDPASEAAELIKSPLKNIVATFNKLQAKPNNVTSGSDNNIPDDQVDWESVMLHEVGHCVGLEHPNVGTQFGLPNGGSNPTRLPQMV